MINTNLLGRSFHRRESTWKDKAVYRVVALYQNDGHVWVAGEGQETGIVFEFRISELEMIPEGDSNSYPWDQLPKPV